MLNLLDSIHVKMEVGRAEPEGAMEHGTTGGWNKASPNNQNQTRQRWKSGGALLKNRDWRHQPMHH